MSALSDNGRRSLVTQLARIAHLRATGPNPFDYWVWADYTAAIVEQAFGVGSIEVRRFEDAISEPGRTQDQRGIADNMTLGLHGEWGIWARLERAQQLLEQITSIQQQPAG